jgi:hypothetical protein
MERRLATRINAFERRVTGAVRVPTADPGSFVERPWNSWTFEQTVVTAADLERSLTTASDIVTQLRARCGLSGEVHFKVSRADIWGTSGGPAFVVPDVKAEFYEISNNTSTVAAVRSVQRDKGTLHVPARLGYSYPMNDTKEIITTDDVSHLICRAQATTSGTHITTRVHVLYKSYA